MSAYDPMEISSPLPSTPPGLDEMQELSPTLNKSKAIIISSDSESESEGRKTPPDLATNQQQQQHGTYHHHHNNNNNNNHNNPNLTPVRTRNTMNNNAFEHRIMSAHNDDAAQFIHNMSWYDYTILDHATTSPTNPNPPITVMLVLTPQPATLADQATCEDFATCFSEDFSNVRVEKTWSAVSLYGHYREWARRSSKSETPPPDESPVPGAWPLDSPDVAEPDPKTTAAPTSPQQCNATDDEKEIGNIHPSALLAKLEQGIDVYWRFSIPVLQQLIEREVKKGMRSIIVGGLKIGDLAGVRAFAQKITEPAGILAFQPENVPSVSISAIVPGEFESRSVMVNIPSVPSLRYVAILAALYAKSSPGVSGKATVIDLVGDGDGDGSSSSSGEDGRRRDDFDSEDVLMRES